MTKLKSFQHQRGFIRIYVRTWHTHNADRIFIYRWPVAFVSNPTRLGIGRTPPRLVARLPSSGCGGKPWWKPWPTGADRHQGKRPQWLICPSDISRWLMIVYRKIYGEEQETRPHPLQDARETWEIVNIASAYLAQVNLMKFQRWVFAHGFYELKWPSQYWRKGKSGSMKQGRQKLEALR